MKKINYTAKDKIITEALKNHPEGLTLREFNALLEVNYQPASFTHAVNAGLIKVIGQKEVDRITKRTVLTYSYVSSDLSEGKKTFTEKEASILKVASTMEGSFTLAELARAMGVDKISSGSVSGLRENNIVVDGEREVESISKGFVNLYGYVADVPTDAVINN